ncbi:hypothetical protein [Methylobacterium komagatae]|uniref:hypothetical protein n=1 Tax=Methylobacterium komagatae TaxID=374425 RepID=UPI00366F7D08
MRVGALTPEEVHGAALLGDRYEAHLALLSSDPTRGRDAELAHSRGSFSPPDASASTSGCPPSGRTRPPCCAKPPARASSATRSS